MKLVRCHIENFGKLANFDFEFVDGLNRVKQANGWGKSTFATFIKAMFYGLPLTTKKDLAVNERKKYLPWQGGNYGGNLVFEIQQKQYKIERFFGKTKAEDTFNLIDLTTNKSSRDFTENLGEEIFGLDAEAFERSSYIPQKVLDDNLNESMAQKLNQMIQGTTENYHFEDTYERLDQKRASLYNNKKTGQIQNLTSVIEDKAAQIRELEVQGQSIVTLQEQVAEKDVVIEDLIQQQNQVKQQINAYGKLQEKLGNQALFTELQRKVDATQAEIEQKQIILNQRKTSVAEIDRYLTADKNVTVQENEICIKTGGDYVAQRYQTLNNYFRGQVPTAETTNAIYQDILQLNAIKTRTENLTTQHTAAQKRTTKWLCVGLIVLAMLSVLIGLAIWQEQRVGAVIAWVVGGLALLGAVFVYLVNLINVKTSTPQNIDLVQLQQDQHMMIKLQKNITTFLEKYESVITDNLTTYHQLMANLNEYTQIKTQMAQNAASLQVLSDTVKREKEQIETYLAQFKLPDVNQSCAEKLVTLKQTLLDLAALQNRLVEEKQALQQFKIEKHFDDKEELHDIDINALQQSEKVLQNQIDELRDAKSQTIARINQIQDALAALNDLENEKQNLQSDLKNLESELKAVKSAMKFLQAANENLATKFLVPTKNGLQKYLALITEHQFDNLNLDTDFNITFEEHGKLREVDYYSQGYQNLINLCLRLALIDALYGQEKPFIVLDDPLVNLDDAKIEKAKQFLQQLAKKYQLVYFSCHESRC